jgi:colanic acid biosynthesis glycosyl transferase WcaI
MNIIILTQSYYPDTVSVSQHLTDFSESLVESGHNVTVLTSSFGYDSEQKFAKNELQNGVKIRRIWQTNFGKEIFILRAVNFLTFNLSLLFVGLLIKKSEVDLVFGSTSPPFSGLVGLILSKIKRTPFYYWVLDLQPELSIASGLLPKNSLMAKLFSFFGSSLIKSSTRIISLDRFMTRYLIEKGADRSKIKELPVWPVSEGQYIGSRDENQFRIEANFNKRIVIMFSGNHAHVHSLSTLLLAAKNLRSNDDILFAFVGGGVRKQDVSNFKFENSLDNITQHPFQPRSSFHISIAASDIQVVILGNGLVGFTHPNKIYGAMFLRKPILYIGPKESHATDILEEIPGNILVEHDDVDLLVEKITIFSKLSLNQIKEIGDANYTYAKNNFNPDVLLKEMIDFVEEYE